MVLPNPDRWIKEEEEEKEEEEGEGEGEAEVEEETIQGVFTDIGQEDLSETEELYLPAQGRQEVSREESYAETENDSEVLTDDGLCVIEERSDEEKEVADGEEGVQLNELPEQDSVDLPEQDSVELPEQDSVEEEEDIEVDQEEQQPEVFNNGEPDEDSEQEDAEEDQLEEEPVEEIDSGEEHNSQDEDEQEVPDGLVDEEEFDPDEFVEVNRQNAQGLLGHLQSLPDPYPEQYSDVIELLTQLLVNPRLDLLADGADYQHDYDTLLLPCLSELMLALLERQMTRPNWQSRVVPILRQLLHQFNHHKDDPLHLPVRIDVADTLLDLLCSIDTGFSLAPTVESMNNFERRLAKIKKHITNLDVEQHIDAIRKLLSQILRFKTDLSEAGKNLWLTINRYQRMAHLHRLRDEGAECELIYMINLKLLRILLALIENLTDSPGFPKIDQTLNDLYDLLKARQPGEDPLPIYGLLDQLFFHIERLPGIGNHFAIRMEVTDMMTMLHEAVTDDPLVSILSKP